jgi:hypothetical protein
MLGEDFCAAGLGQGVPLQGEILVGGRDAGIADQHEQNPDWRRSPPTLGQQAHGEQAARPLGSRGTDFPSIALDVVEFSVGAEAVVRFRFRETQRGVELTLCPSSLEQGLAFEPFELRQIA